MPSYSCKYCGRSAEFTILVRGNRVPVCLQHYFQFKSRREKRSDKMKGGTEIK